jgi:PAS domain S-box-containing protein
MQNPIQILMVEDVPTDAEIIQYELTRSRITFHATVVDNETDFRENLSRNKPDLILSDYSLPSFDGISAFLILKKVRPETPFIFVSGEIGEDLAIEAMKLGVTDYVFKDRLQRLGPAVKRAMSELDEKNRRREMENQILFLASMVESSEDAIIGVDLELRVFSWNEGAMRMSGYTPEDVIGKPVNILTPDEHRNEERLQFESLARGEKLGHFETVRVRKDGRRLDVSLSISPVRNHSSAIIGYSLIARDISERIRTQRQLEELNRNLERRIREEVDKNREKDLLLIRQSRLSGMAELIRNISHYWRQPLNALGIIIQNIRYNYDTGELSSGYIDSIINRTMDILQNLSRSIDDFRIFSKSDEEKTVFDTSELVEHAISFVRPAYRSDFVEIHGRFTPGILISGMPNEFSNVLINLLNNAREALVDRKIADPVIELEVRAENGKAVLVVRDNAGGIAPEIQEHIFEPYFTTREKGTGIGLYMSKMMIEQNMHGYLTFRNTAEGAEFRVELPVVS